MPFSFLGIDLALTRAAGVHYCTVQAMADMRFDASQLSSISRLFSSGVIRDLARKGRSAQFARLAKESSLAERPKNRKVRDLFDQALTVLQRDGHRDEYIYRAVLTNRVLLGTHRLRTALMLSEFRVGACRADVAILNGTSTVYEIKSDRDSLTRLASQLEAYRTVFARVVVIAGQSHIDDVLRAAAKDVGVMCLYANRGRCGISTIRAAKNAPSRTNAAAIFDSIRTNEARQILAEYGVAIPDVPNTRLHAEMRHLFGKLRPRDAHAGMVRALKRSRNLAPLSDLISELPESLSAAALTIPLRRSDHDRLVQAVNTRLSEAIAWG